MAERCIKGDYIGFTFGGVHSSELGLMRVSNGSRYEQDLLPPLQDKTAQVNGRDGAVYFGSQYNTKPIKVPVAFDNMTEESFNQLKRLLQDKKPKYLWFDETPYKQWLVKAANVQNFKWVCFDESHNGKEKRVYKGEGTLEFSCFSPYAESRVTFLDDDFDSIIFNANGKLFFGTTPCLEVLTIQDGHTERQLFSSSLIGNKVMRDKKFTIKEANNLVIKYDGDNYSNSCKEYVSIMTQKGFLTLAELNLVERSDTTSTSPTYGFWGLARDGSFHSTGRIGIIDEVELKKIREYINDPITHFTNTDSKGFQRTSETIKVRAYGSSYEKSVSVRFYRLAVDSNDQYFNHYNDYNFVIDNRSQPYILIYEDSLGFRKVLKPIYDMNNNLSEIEETNIDIKVLSLKEGLKDGNNLAPAPNNLTNSYNYYEWVVSSGLRKKYDSNYNVNYNVYNKTKKSIPVYNAGDKSTDLFITYSSKPTEDFTLSIASSYAPTEKIGEIKIKTFDFGYVLDENGNKIYDNGFVIDSKLKLIKGLRDGKPSGVVYNKAKMSGDFFKIPVCEYDEYYTITSSIDQEFSVEYKHYYI